MRRINLIIATATLIGLAIFAGCYISFKKGVERGREQAYRIHHINLDNLIKDGKKLRDSLACKIAYSDTCWWCNRKKIKRDLTINKAIPIIGEEKMFRTSKIKLIFGSDPGTGFHGAGLCSDGCGKDMNLWPDGDGSRWDEIDTGIGIFYPNIDTGFWTNVNSGITYKIGSVGLIETAYSNRDTMLDVVETYYTYPGKYKLRNGKIVTKSELKKLRGW